MQNVCPLCERRVSEWQMACGKTVIINGAVTHKSCLMDKTIAEMEVKWPSR